MIKKICILGSGESGVGAALLAKQKGVNVFVSEYGIIKDQFRNELLRCDIPFEEKGHTIDKIVEADVVIKSPGIPQNTEVVLTVRQRGIPIISEIEFASRFFEGKMIAVTGSNGKTTTTSLIYHIMSHAGINCCVCGNIGKSFARVISEGQNFDWAILELSSFQLEDIDDFNADIAVILNITPDHLDRYENNMFKYASAKWNLASNQNEGNELILNANDDWLELKKIDVPVKSRITELHPDRSVEGIVEVLKLKGKHNLYNANVAYKVCELAGLESNAILNGISAFEAIPHRLETVAIIDEVEYINDSKATNIDSARVALSSMNKPVIWIAGGTDKGNDYNQLRELVKDKVKAIICLTLDDSKLRSSFANSIERIESVADMHTCVEMASKLAKKGDQVLLSPANASFDLFDNYEHRGDRFREEVLRMRLG